MICPMCAATVETQAEACPSCATGLVEYATVAYLPHWLVNKALTRLRRDQWAEAATLFAQASLFLESDPEVYRGWAHALVQTGRLEEALDVISHAAELGDRPAQAEYDEILALIAAQTPPAAGETGPPIADDSEPALPTPGGQAAETSGEGSTARTKPSVVRSTRVRRRTVVAVRVRNRGTARHFQQEPVNPEQQLGT